MQCDGPMRRVTRWPPEGQSPRLSPHAGTGRVCVCARVCDLQQTTRELCEASPSRARPRPGVSGCDWEPPTGFPPFAPCPQLTASGSASATPPLTFHEWVRPHGVRLRSDLRRSAQHRTPPASCREWLEFSLLMPGAQATGSASSRSSRPLMDTGRFHVSAAVNMPRRTRGASASSRWGYHFLQINSTLQGDCRSVR